MLKCLHVVDFLLTTCQVSNCHTLQAAVGWDHEMELTENITAMILKMYTTSNIEEANDPAGMVWVSCYMGVYSFYTFFF